MNSTFLLSHFDRISDAPGAIPRLRTFIIDLAVRGKLVEQDPKDEPTSDLLQRIRLEKARGVKDGKVKPQWALPTFDESEMPCRLPSSWHWVHFGELITAADAGWSPETEGFPRSGDHWGVLKVSAVSWNKFLPEENKQLLPGSVPPGAAQVHAGDFLISRANTSELVAKCVVVEQEPTNLILSDKIVRLQISARCNKKFLSMVNNHAAYARAYYAEEASGTSLSMQNVSRAVIYGLLIPLPPFAEQNRIVSKVDELMALCDRLEMAKEERENRRDRLSGTSHHYLNNGTNTDDLRKHAHFFIGHLPHVSARPDQIKQLRQTILSLAGRGKLVPQDRNEGSGADLAQLARRSKQRICEEAGSKTRRLLPTIRPEEISAQLPSAWTWERIGNLALIRGGKRLPRGVKFSHVRTPHIYIRVTDMRNQTVLLNDLQYLDEATHHRLARYIIEKEDIFVVIVGATIGKVGVIPNELDRMHLTENAARLSFCDIDQRYFLLALQSDLVQSQFIAKTYQQAQPKLALNRIESTLVPIPPLQEQRRIVAKFDELMALCDQLEAQLTTAQEESVRLLESVLVNALENGPATIDHAYG